MRVFLQVKKFSVLLVLLLSAFAKVSAQESFSCKVINALPNGSYEVSINDSTYLAITEKMIDRTLIKEDSLRLLVKLVKRLEEQISIYEKTESSFNNSLERYKNLATEMDSALTLYEKAYQVQKKIKRGSWLSFEGGIGATGEHEPAVLMGLGISRFRIWGFAQESNAGVMLGVSLPLL